MEPPGRALFGVSARLQDRARAALAKGDVEPYVAALGPYGGGALVHSRPLLTDLGVYERAAVRYLFRRGETEIDKPSTKLRGLLLATLDLERCRAEGDAVPDGKIVLYRGCVGWAQSRGWHALRWTTSLDRARASLAGITDGDPAVYRLTVRRKNVIAWRTISVRNGVADALVIVPLKPRPVRVTERPEEWPWRWRRTFKKRTPSPTVIRAPRGTRKLGDADPKEPRMLDLSHVTQEQRGRATLAFRAADVTGFLATVDPHLVFDLVSNNAVALRTHGIFEPALFAALTARRSFYQVPSHRLGFLLSYSDRAAMRRAGVDYPGELPAELTLYRGTSGHGMARRDRGFHWTVSLERAREYARCSAALGDPGVVRVSLPSEDVSAFYLERDVIEVLAATKRAPLNRVE